MQAGSAYLIRYGGIINIEITLHNMFGAQVWTLFFIIIYKAVRNQISLKQGEMEHTKNLRKKKGV